jgi:hypothetical protein
MGFQDYSHTQNSNENLSTFTNEGSLQSRFRNFNQPEDELEDKSSHKSNKYWSFQIPVMLTPWEIMKLNQLLSEERGDEE